jgi:maltose alpha-D-glucosyltransferase/alpha-amylase
MALRLEDRLPITEIMSQTPDIPENCQWGLFLRNHDELTLEMVSDEERDYMYTAYSADPRMRINIGIRRRLAPLVDNSRRRIELLNSLLFSFPGTPIMYYGDEIGMGDNIYLGDRNGVRTPMQWSPDRNAGFSRATPARLYSPLIMDPVYGFEAVNVEAQQGEASSLLNWMRNMIALRKLFKVFGRGTLEFLNPSNQKVLAYLRFCEGEHVLCVANLSRFAQPVELDLSALAGLRPVEMLGYVDFPVIGRRPYTLTLGPYGFLWFELHNTSEPAEVRPTETEAALVCDVSDGWRAIFTGAGLRELESRGLPDYLPRQRWFGGKSRRIQSASVADWGEFDGSRSALALVDVRYENLSSDTYFVPLAMSFGEAAVELRAAAPHAIVAAITSRGDGEGVLHDAVFDDSACAAFLSCIENRGELATRNGAIRGIPGAGLATARGPAETPLLPVRGSAEQSNTSILFGDRLILKLFRRQEPGPNPDCEINAFLGERTSFEHVPPFAGSLEYRREGAEASTLAMLQGLVRNEGDGWKWTLEELDRYYESCARIPFPVAAEATLSDVQAQELAREHLGLYLASATVLGRRTGEMHLALASETQDPAFAPEAFGSDDLRALSAELRENATRVFDALKENLGKLPDEVVEPAGLALSRRRRYHERFDGLARLEVKAQRTRIHGDFHLGQTLRVKNDYVILDFEGEPARSLAERRARHSPLKDVAGMLRSFSYAAFAALLSYTARRPEYFETLEPWARLWEGAIAAEFLREYRLVTEGAAFLPREGDVFQKLLDAYLLDKALYELRYELDNRPAWVRIPLWGILSL